MLFDLIGVDVELAGVGKPIAIGVATLNERGEYNTKCYVLPGVKLPEDAEGQPVLQKSGEIRNCPIACYNDFTPDQWVKFWRHHGKMLALQVDWGVAAKSADDVWKSVREHVDRISQKAYQRGAVVRVVSDNAGVDVGIINENFKRAYSDTRSPVTLDYLMREDGIRRHSFVVDSRSPRWQRQLGIICYFPLRLAGIKILKHYAPHDALLCLCEYAGYLLAYPQVEWPESLVYQKK